MSGSGPASGSKPAPRRIVSTTPSITETLFALGIGDRLVGVSEFSNYPPEARRLPRIGSYSKPDIEAIARVRPDLVILERGAGEVTERLRAIGIATLEVPYSTLEEVYAGITLIGEAAGVEDRAAGLVARIRGSLQAIAARARATASPRVLVIIDRQPGALNEMTAIGPGNYLNQILGIAGASNVLARPGLPQYPRISLETILREDPDVLIDLSGTQETDAARRASREATLALWSQRRELRAVRSGHVYAGTADALVVPGPRSPVAAGELFNFVHGIGGSD